MKALPYISALLFCVMAFSLDFVQDDQYIALRYAQNLVDGNGLVWNVGERVEGFTSPLWVGLSAGLIYLGLPPIPILQLLGVASGLGIIALMTWGFRAGPATLLVGASPFMAFWGISGMEQVFFSFLLLLSVLAVEKKWLVWVLVLLTLTRPEGIFVSLILLVAVAGSNREHTMTEAPMRRAIGALRKFASMPATYIYLAFLALFFGLRYWYYGSLVPNTAVAKTGFSAEYIMAGLQYTVDFARDGLLYGAVLIPIVWLFIKPKEKT